jgi:hypothetical protein
MEKEGVINQTVKDFSKQSNIIQTVIIFLVAFLVPTFLGNILTNVFGKTSVIASNSQLVVGSIVNVALIMSALNLKGKAKIIGVVTMPSISTVLSGYVFKTASVYMAYMIPVLNKEKNYLLASIVGIVLKVAVIFGAFSLLNALGIFPEKLVSNLQKAMSVTQLITATVGAVITYIVYIVEKKSIKA